MRKVKDIATEVLTRQGRYKQVADNLQVKEVWVGDGEQRKRYILCLNPQEAERERQRRAQRGANSTPNWLLEQRDDDHRRRRAREGVAPLGSYLSADGRGRPQLDLAKIKAAEK